MKHNTILRVLALAVSILASVAHVAAQEWDYDSAWEDTLQTSRVSAVKEKIRNTTQTGLMRLDSRKLNAGYAVFGTPDVIKTLQLMPGVAAGSELMSGLYVHGGDGYDNLFLLDGVPLYNISHFGGLFSSFNTDVIDNLDFYKSGFPARFGGKLSSVVDVQTREGNMQKWSGSASIGLIDGRLQVEGPLVKGKTSINVALRRTWLDLITTPIIKYANIVYKMGDNGFGGHSFMQDFNAGLTHRFSERSKLNLRFFSGKDDLAFDYKDNLDFEDDPSWFSLDMNVGWGSTTASATWDYEFSKGLTSKLLAYWTQSKSDIAYKMIVDLGESGSMDMHDENISYVRDLGVNYDFVWTPQGDGHRVRYGATGQLHRFHSSRGFSLTNKFGGMETTEGEGISLPEKQSYPGFETAAYLEDEWFLRYNITLNTGLRVSAFNTDKFYSSIEPRVALKWLLARDYSLKASYTRMTQYVHLVSAIYMDLPSNCWMPSTAGAAPMYSDQIAGGLYSTPWKDVTLNIEGWFKTMDGILAYNGSNMFYPPLTGWEQTFVSGKGKSYGLEAELSWNVDRGSLAAYYTLSRNLRKFDEFYQFWYRDRNDNKHKLNLVASWKVSDKLDFFANWNYHSGNRVTFPTHVTEGSDNFLYDVPYNTKMPDYHRLDLGANFNGHTKKGRDYTINLSVYNAYNHANAAIATFDTDNNDNYSGTGYYVGTAYGLVPILPTLSYTLHF